MVLTGEKTETNTAVVAYSDEEQLRYLPDNARIRFTLPNGNEIEARIENRELSVRGNSQLMVFPQVSNVIQLSVFDWSKQNAT